MAASKMLLLLLLLVMNPALRLASRQSHVSQLPHALAILSMTSSSISSNAGRPSACLVPVLAQLAGGTAKAS
ncbi:hypothetical protein HDK90DRAFT_476371 [Phyllosticta capitalensis]|uniref:Uncharacterized protein n=1 Tax=Phyllosticta capitalensis TaxID=121624 RepID=A0ABR1Z054_9PEZI